MTLAPLIVEWMRGVDGTDDVLRDALLERSLDPMPPTAELVERLELVLARLRELDQARVAAAGVRRLVPSVSDRDLQTRIAEALAAADSGSPLDTHRNGLFKAWQSASGVDRRIAWAAWMVLRGSPAIALRTVRAIRGAEGDAQIGLVADAFGRDLA